MIDAATVFAGLVDDEVTYQSNAHTQLGDAFFCPSCDHKPRSADALREHLHTCTTYRIVYNAPTLNTILS